MSHLVLVDGHHLMYRAFYAIPASLKTSNGEQTNAVYGVASMLISLLKAEEPTHLLFCFDAGEETFRHQENATYKEGRAETPDEFYTQIPRILEMIESFPIQHVSNPKYEADDLLCVYAKAGEKAGMRVTVVTGDRDAFQLSTEKVRIAIPHKGYQAPEYLGPKEILAKYGVRPDQVASYKGISGDSSDNLPGVKGIGPKGASMLLQAYGTLTGVYEHLDEIKGTMREKLERDRDQAFFCERMATLVSDFDLAIPLKDLELTEIKTGQIVAFMKALEFHSLTKRLQVVCESAYGKQHFVWEGEPTMKKKTVKSEDQMALF
ncbi:hypothetical protein EXS70_04470 [Candidatus Peribacteria bacterium]|nr:hypothetical protein [Candidatus Peribacteria bacterium]